MHDELTEAFKEAMAHVSAPVSVMTTMRDGQPAGSTVSAFASLSVTPPMIILALDNRGSLIDQLRETGLLGINILASDQAQIAVQFARRVPDRFAGLDWQPDDGVPRLAGITAWLFSDELQFEPGGDHTVVLATISKAETLGDDGLTYYRRDFGSALAGITRRGLL